MLRPGLDCVNPTRRPVDDALIFTISHPPESTGGIHIFFKLFVQKEEYLTLEFLKRHIAVQAPASGFHACFCYVDIASTPLHPH